MCGGLPFTFEAPNYSQKTLGALAETKRISRDEAIFLRQFSRFKEGSGRLNVPSQVYLCF